MCMNNKNRQRCMNSKNGQMCMNREKRQGSVNKYNENVENRGVLGWIRIRMELFCGIRK
jgi:hypothetical protein